MLICKRKESKRKKRKLVGSMTWPLMWFNRSVVIINVMLHLLNLYIYIDNKFNIFFLLKKSHIKWACYYLMFKKITYGLKKKKHFGNSTQRISKKITNSNYSFLISQTHPCESHSPSQIYSLVFLSTPKLFINFFFLISLSMLSL